MKLFGTDGVRGEAGSFLTAELAMRVAMAAGIYFRERARTKKILVGKDTRRSGYMIENAIVSGLTAVGYDVVQIGPMPTPAIAFLTENMRCDAGIMISASHNSFEDNGIKFFDAHGNKLSEEIEAQIEAIANDRERLVEGYVTGKMIGSAKRIDDVIGRYIIQLKNSFSRDLTLQGLRIVLDTANGAGYLVGPTVLEELGAEVIVLHDKPNGFNINEACGATHTKDLRHAVKKYRADIGLALDGDADRLIVVDEHGDEIDGDQILGALALYLHKNGQLRGGGIVTTVMSNQALEDMMEAHGLKLYRANVGDKYVLEQMREHGINFGGEQSGHIVMSDFAKTGDGLVSALQILGLLLTSGGKASKLLRPFALYPQKLVNIKVEIKKPLNQIEGLEEELRLAEASHLRHLIRYSGTENKLRILLEGKDAKAMENCMERLVDFFKKALNG
ncbi:MAG: phosphoglucosamine mutase [Sulfuricurvum sp.]|uniref:phosphoglucosamine mutase n=1 Tax=Sulfuricurvum sp. TaxID=2025608 RepID=UPI0025F5FC70|nr:phosphoglucosamine mutase [Sulfuricurvum sp.]MCK9371869.1 phosphoglucosamine mutase [Sulfuricurvum sp.]